MSDYSIYQMFTENKRLKAKNKVLSDAVEVLTDEQVKLESENQALIKALATCSAARARLDVKVDTQAERIEELEKELNALTDIPF